MAKLVIQQNSFHKESNSKHKWPFSGFATFITIISYFVLSVSLTFYHKWCMQAVKLPFFVVLSHFSLKWILVTAIRLIYACATRRPLKEVSCTDQVTRILPLGVFSALDIAFGSWGLLIIPVSLYTMTKSSTIIFILGFALIFKLEKKSWSLVVIVAMISIGLFMFTYKATQFDLFGFTMVLFASFSSGLRWTSAQFIMQRSELRLKNPLDLMYYTQPWMFLTVLPFFYFIEGGKIVHSLSSEGWDKWLPVFGGGFIALAMELAEFLVLLSTSSLTLSVIGIFKEVTTVILAVKWNGDTMSSLNFAGLLLCLGGILCHVVHKAQLGAGPGAGPRGAVADEAAAKFLPEGSTSSEEDERGEDSSTEVLFSVLNSRDR
ncbi:solute carrier family 35 member C2 [Nilaparvata lugens]|uniref:solute carrier family 35 member C2 n=1 Tax=Nilaparvata lugens TaxID=108931 RepID=UPI00193CCAE9|nr:solute carrier family 35 member C2 [Nilaparvata lugens]